jgi:hypothetical protein
MKCVLCKDSIDTEHPLSVYERNPKTFRLAWMHYFCLEVEVEIAAKEPSRSKRDGHLYDSRLDEMVTRFG